jgi:hypothetical protein
MIKMKGTNETSGLPAPAPPAPSGAAMSRIANGDKTIEFMITSLMNKIKMWD